MFIKLRPSKINHSHEEFPFTPSTNTVRPEERTKCASQKEGDAKHRLEGWTEIFRTNGKLSRSANYLWHNLIEHSQVILHLIGRKVSSLSISRGNAVDLCAQLRKFFLNAFITAVNMIDTVNGRFTMRC